MTNCFTKKLFCLVLFSISFSKADQTLTIANETLQNCNNKRVITSPAGNEICCEDPNHAKACTAAQILKARSQGNKSVENLIAITKKPKDPVPDFQKEFSDFCSGFLKNLNVSVQKPVSIANPGTTVDLGALAKKQNLSTQTPCGLISSESKGKFDSDFPKAIRGFCTDMTKKHPQKARLTDGRIEFGTIKSTGVISSTDSCILGNVQLVGNHRLQNAVIIGLHNFLPLIVDSTENPSLSLTWSGIYFGNGKQTTELKGKIENGSALKHPDSITELTNIERLQFRTSPTRTINLDELPAGDQRNGR